MFASQKIGRTATVTLASLVLSTATLAFATAPARASTASPVATWQDSVNREIDHTIRAPAAHASVNSLAAVLLDVRFDANGHFADASIKRSSGSREIDAEALRAARTIAYPPLPAEAAGRTVTMQLFFGPDAEVAAEDVRQQQKLAQR